MALHRQHLVPLTLTAATLLGVASIAQDPAPGPATDRTIWSAQEASALTHVRRILGGAKGNDARPIRLPRLGLSIPGYRIWCWVPGVGDEVDEIVHTRSATLAEDMFLLAWPVADTTETRRGIALHSDGTTMFCEVAGNDVPGPSADVITAKGSDGTFTDVLRQPGTSTTGHFWLWLQQASKHASVIVVDQSGVPRQGYQVALVPKTVGWTRDDVRPPAGPWPIAQGVTDAMGWTRLSGPLCNDLRIVLRSSGGTQVAADFACQPTADGLRIVLTKTALRRATVRGNERAVRATLRNISNAQAQCQASAAIDVDADGRGEYGYFAELAGTVAVRGEDQRKIHPPVLNRAFANIAQSCTLRRGYFYRIYLPAGDGKGTCEAATGGGKGRGVIPDLAEQAWCCYAWPVSPDTGKQAFFINQGGDIFRCANLGEDGKLLYVGIEGAISVESAFAEGETGMLGNVAINDLGQNGLHWAEHH